MSDSRREPRVVWYGRIGRSGYLLHIGERVLDVDEIRTWQCYNRIIDHALVLTPPITMGETAGLLRLVGEIGLYPQDRLMDLMIRQLAVTSVPVVPRPVPIPRSEPVLPVDRNLEL